MKHARSLKDIAKQRGNRHLNIAFERYQFLANRDVAQLPPTKPDRKPRHNARRMRYIERGVEFLQASSNALDYEILTFALRIRAQIPVNQQEPFERLFKKKNQTIQVGQTFLTLGAKQLHGLAASLVEHLGLRPAWPNAYSQITEPRNQAVHRMSYPVRGSEGEPRVNLLEDASPELLRDCAEASAGCLVECFRCFDALNQSKAQWPSIHVPALASRAKALEGKPSNGTAPLF
jgi:hypothetical protein